MGCQTTKETVKLVYIYPTIINPGVEEIPELPVSNTITVEEYPNYVLFPSQELNLLSQYLIDMEFATKVNLANLLYFIKVTDWNKERTNEDG